jgi:tyrosyl-tRNA synthetase
MNFLEEFKSKGYFYQCTDEEALSKLSSQKPISFYVGFDCTAQSLHVGNLMQIMILRLLQRYGHKPIVLVGGATTKIGDPSGKDEARKMLSDEDIESNIAGIKKSLSKFIKFGAGESDAIIVNNKDWLESLGYVDFLREFGREFSVNRMLTMDSVKLRLEREQNLTFLEFNYMLLQAYDFMYLSQKYDCALQLGGSDQWGNIVMGSELIRRKLSKPAFGLTTPLLTTSSGAKMGKSASGAIWINEEMLSPYDYFQYWRNTEDADVIKFSKLYAEFSDDEQNEFEELSKKNINEAKKKLAFRLCELCHGLASAENSLETARKVFEEGGIGEDLPTYQITISDLEKGISAYEIFFNSGLCESKSEAKKLIRGGGARVNNEKILDESLLINMSFLDEKDYIKLSAGKKKHILVKI